MGRLEWLHSLWSGAALGLVAGSVALGGLVALLQPSVQAALLVLIGLLLIAPLAVRVSRGTFDIFAPVTVFAMAFGFFIVARTAAVMITGEYAWRGLDTHAGLTPM